MHRMLLLLILALSYLQAEAGGSDLFIKAVKEGDLNSLENLLSAGFDPNQPVHGYTPLYLAIQSNQLSVVDLLLARHADPNAAAKDEGVADRYATPLQLAVELDNPRLVSILLRSGAQVNAKGTAGRTALHFAAKDVRLDAMHFLLDRGAEVNVRDAEGSSPLDDAVWLGSLDVTALLLAHGAHLNDPNPQTGATPINEAAFRGHTKVIQFLLAFNPDLSIRDTRGYRPFDNALRMGHESSAVALLDAEPKERQTHDFLMKAMEAAAAKDESGLVAALLGRGVSANDALPSGITPLDAAAGAGALKVVKTLLSGGADPNLMGVNGATPLEDASLKGFDTIADLLLDHGALVNGFNRASGTTALYAAAAFGRAPVVKLLLSRGANPGLCGNNRKSPYQAAMANDHGDVADLIESQGGARSCKP